jgi:hypothetical protein
LTQQASTSEHTIPQGRLASRLVTGLPVYYGWVILAVAGFVPHEQEQIRLCSEMGLGPGRLDEIEVLGKSIADVHFDLVRLEDNVLELPIPFCLDRVSLGELQIVAHGLRMAGILDEGVEMASDREQVMAVLLPVLTRPDYIRRAVATLPATGRDVLQRVIVRGGTSGNYYDLLDGYVSVHRESNSSWAGLRSLMRLGLAYVFHGQHKPYVVLAEGVSDVYSDLS